MKVFFYWSVNNRHRFSFELCAPHHIINGMGLRAIGEWKWHSTTDHKLHATETLFSEWVREKVAAPTHIQIATTNLFLMYSIFGKELLRHLSLCIYEPLRILVKHIKAANRCEFQFFFQQKSPSKLFAIINDDRQLCHDFSS